MTDIDALFQSYSRQAFRLETLPMYRVAGEWDEFQHYLQTGEISPSAADLAWRHAMHDKIKVGAQHIRLRVLEEPINAYQIFETLLGYIPFAKNGADIHFIDRAVFDRLLAAHKLKAIQDFWLLDETTVLLMEYAPDGGWLGIKATTAPDVVACRINIRDTLLQHTYGLTLLAEKYPDLFHQSA